MRCIKFWHKLKQRECFTLTLPLLVFLNYFALAVFFAAALFAGGFLLPTATAFLLPFFASTPRNCVAVNPCCLHNFLTVSKSEPFDTASNFAFSSASAFSCASISISRCCAVLIFLSPVVKTVQSPFLKFRAWHSLASFCASAIFCGVILAAMVTEKRNAGIVDDARVVAVDYFAVAALCFVTI